MKTMALVIFLIAAVMSAIGVMVTEAVAIQHAHRTCVQEHVISGYYLDEAQGICARR